MSELNICTICLRINERSYKCNQYLLAHYYQALTASKISVKDDLPNYFCYECAILLHKFYKFREKCSVAKGILTELHKKQMLTIAQVSNIKNTFKIFKPNINILVKSKFVKTCTVKQRTPLEKLILNLDQSKSPDSDSNHIPSANEDVSDYEPEVNSNENEVIDKSVYYDSDGNKSVTLCEINQDIFVKEENQLEEQLQIFAELNEVQNEEVGIEFEPKRKRSLTKRKPKKCRKHVKKKFKRRERKALDPNNWKTVLLTEEEAVKEFNVRKENPKYLEAPFKCTSCYKHFLTNDTLERHIRIVHAESLGDIECQMCRMRFRLKCYLRRHISKHYTRHHCRRCSYVCDIDSTALLHDEFHSGIFIKCKYCSEEFRHRTTYYTHLRSHRSEHVCALCGESFVSAVGLRQHQRVKHAAKGEEAGLGPGRGRPNYCARCDMAFDSAQAFDHHLISSAMHVEEPTPEKKYTKKMHRRNRYAKKPTTCYQCGAEFGTQAACLKHHLAAHPRTSFYAPSQRQICEVCGVSVAPGCMSTHLNRHTRSRLYTCDTCGRQFLSQMVLKRHLITHTGEKPFGCTLCEKRFTQKGSMLLHFRTYHLKQPYPKRNRKKKITTEEYRLEGESEGSLTH